jgi:hypothetical protein
MKAPMKLQAIMSLALLASGQAFAQEKPDILQIFDQFVLTSAAASKCAKPEEKTLTSFLANFQMISIRASMALSERYPGHTKDQIAGAMKRESEMLTQKVNEAISAKGCDDASIQDLLKRFDV